jgi:hypothetical protein
MGVLGIVFIACVLFFPKGGWGTTLAWVQSRAAQEANPLA